MSELVNAENDGNVQTMSDDVAYEKYKEFKKICDTQNLEDVKTFYSQYSEMIDLHKNSVLIHLCENNYFEIANWYFPLHSDFDQENIHMMIMAVTTSSGYMEMTQLLISMYLNLDNDDKYCAFCNSIRSGNLELSQWIYSLGMGEYMTESFSDECLIAIRCGYLETVKWLLSLQPDMNLTENAFYPLSTTIDICIEKNYLEMTKWLFERYPENMRDLRKYFCTASSKGYLEMCQWLLSINSRLLNLINKDIIVDLCSSNKFEMIQWIHSLKPINIIIEDLNETFNIVCYLGHLQIAQWLYGLQKIDDITYAFNVACTNGHLDIAQWLYSINPEIDINDEDEDEEEDEEEEEEEEEDEESEHNLNNFESSCVNGKLDVAKWLYSILPYETLIKDNEYLFETVCANGHLEVAQWLLTIFFDYDTSTNDYNAFKNACEHGHKEVAEWLLSLNPDMDLHAKDEIYFCIACECGQLNIAKWLLSIRPDINIRGFDDYSFKRACENNHLKMVEWLVTLKPELYSFELENEYTINMKIFSFIIDKPHTREIEKKDIENCSICYNDTPEIITKCNHQYCKECIETWMKRENICPYCRGGLMRHNLFMIVSK